MNRIGKIVGVLFCLMIVCATFVSAVPPVEEDSGVSLKSIGWRKEDYDCERCHRGDYTDYTNVTCKYKDLSSYDLD